MSIEKEIMDKQILFEKIILDNVFKNNDSMRIFNRILELENHPRVLLAKEKSEIKKNCENIRVRR